MSETEQQGSSADEGEKQMTTEEAEKARAARRLRRELRKLAVGPSILYETDTEIEEQDQQQDLPAAAPVAAVAAAEQAAAEQAPDPADGTSGGTSSTAPQETIIRENKEIPVPLNKKVVLKHYKIAEANPSGAKAYSAKDRPNLYGDGYRDNSNPSGESSLKGQSDTVNKAYKAAQALRLSTRVNPDMGGRGDPCWKNAQLDPLGTQMRQGVGSVITDH
jgi:hypothetical protein